MTGKSSHPRKAHKCKETVKAMSLQNKRVGAPITISLRAAGAPADFIPARLASVPTIEVINGRMTEVATVLTAQVNRATGETYIGERIHNLLWAFDRTERVALLDGSEQEPKSLAQVFEQKAAATMAYLMSEPEAAPASIDLAAL